MLFRSVLGACGKYRFDELEGSSHQPAAAGKSSYGQGKKGGAFFGCAVPVEDEKILFYYTGHYGDHGKDREAEEAQVMVESQDSISFGTDRTEDLRYL